MNLEIAGRLVALRRDAGFSQEELAARLGVSRQAVSKWERAESSPDTDNLIALANLYGISLDALLLRQDDGAAVQAEPVYAEEEDEEDIFEAGARWDETEEAYEQARRKRLRHSLLVFPYPVAVTILFLALGFSLGWWHPGWMLYLTIPIYYCLAAGMTK